MPLLSSIETTNETIRKTDIYLKAKNTVLSIMGYSDFTSVVVAYAHTHAQTPVMRISI